MFVIPSMITAFLIRRYVMAMFPITFSLGDFDLSRDFFITILLIVVMLFTGFRTMFSTRKASPGQTTGYVVIAFGILTGVLSGFIGAGGGFIIVPILLRMGLDMKKAVGTSMFIISIQSAVALLGDFLGDSIEAEGSIDWHILLLITLMTVIGTLFGGYLQRFFSGKMLRNLFSMLLVIVAVGMSIQFFLK